MYFDLSDDQKALRDTLVPFCQRWFGQAGGVAAIETTALDQRLWRDINALGLGGMMVPVTADGLDMGCLTLAVVAEVLGSHAVTAPVTANILAAWIIAQAGDETQRSIWLDKLVAGEAVAAFAFAEEDGSLPRQWSLDAARATGRKTSVQWGLEADLLIVGLDGGHLGVVTPGANGVTRTPIDSLDRTAPLAEIVFDGAVLEHLPASPALVARLFDALLIAFSADALGAAAALHARAVDYAKERRQYGQLIGSFQALKHQLADMSVELEPARSLVWYAAYAWDTARVDAHRMAAITKAHVGEIAVKVSRGAIEALGGIGYTWEYPAHLLLKRAMSDRSLLGTPQLHRERAARLAGWSGTGDVKTGSAQGG